MQEILIMMPFCVIGVLLLYFLIIRPLLALGEIPYEIHQLRNELAAKNQMTDGERSIYNMGLEDAWEYARKIAEREDDMRNCFHDIAPSQIFSRYSAFDAIQMIKKYDNKRR